MKQTSISVCLAGVLAGIAVILFSFSCLDAATPHTRTLTPEVSRDAVQFKTEELRHQEESGRMSKATQPEPKKVADPIIVSPETLAQAVQDDVNAAAKKYHLTELQIDGIVSKRSVFKDGVAVFQFDLKVKDRKTDKLVDFTIFFSLKDPVQKDDKRLDEFAVGKKVTVRGKSIAMGNGQVTLLYCVIVRDSDKGGAKK